MSEDASFAMAGQVAREAYSQLLASLASRSGDLAGAEDALGDAFLSALRQWPLSGVPENPRGWIWKVARNRQVDAIRRMHAIEKSLDAVDSLSDSLLFTSTEQDSFQDDRLKLLFVCAHPAIDYSIRTPLMLQTILGLSAEIIAGAFLTSPKTMSQRLVRAKTKIRSAKIGFQIPGPEEWDERLSYVLEAIYVAFTAGCQRNESMSHEEGSMVGEAIWLGRMLCHLAPKTPEALGLLSLMLHSQSRQGARRSSTGVFISLEEQDIGRWNRDMIVEAEALLQQAASFGQIGRYQLEACIQSVHAQRLHSKQIPWNVIVMLYQALMRETPAVGAQIGHALAHAKFSSAKEGLAYLNLIDSALVETHQAYWAARASLLMKNGQKAEAVRSYQKALGLTEDQSVRQYLQCSLEPKCLPLIEFKETTT